SGCQHRIAAPTRRCINSVISQLHESDAVRRTFKRLTGESDDLIYSFRIVSPTRDWMIREPPTFACVDDETWIVRLFVVVLIVDGKHLAHVDAESVRQYLIGRSHGRLIGSQPKIAS